MAGSGENMYDYINDKYGKICLEWARQCKTKIGFGAVLVKNNIIIGQGRNRHSTPNDRFLIPGIDYASHAEQSCILDALRHGYDVTKGTVYVLGLCLSGKNKGTLTTRTEHVFICSKCPRTFIKFNVSVCIPHINGWSLLEAKEAMEIGTKLANKGYWGKFANTTT